MQHLFLKEKTKGGDEMQKKRISIETFIEELDEHGATEDSDKTEQTAECIFREEQDGIKLSYSEKNENGTVFCDITVSDGSVIVKRSGDIESEFVFSEGLLHTSAYRIPPYSFDAEIFTRKIRNNLTRCGGTLSLIYDLKVGERVSRMRMKIRVDELCS